MGEIMGKVHAMEEYAFVVEREEIASWYYWKGLKRICSLVTNRRV